MKHVAYKIPAFILLGILFLAQSVWAAGTVEISPAQAQTVKSLGTVNNKSVPAKKTANKAPTKKTLATKAKKNTIAKNKAPLKRNIVTPKRGIEKPRIAMNYTPRKSLRPESRRDRIARMREQVIEEHDGNGADPRKYAAFMFHPETGEVLYDQNADERRYPASLAKMMTLYLTFDQLKKNRLSMNTVMNLSRHAASQPSMNLNVRPGDKMTVRDAVNAVVVRSANDAAVALAEKISGNEVAFASQMTRTAQTIGMKNTTFRNASGLFHPQQISTARDMAILLSSLEEDFPEYYDLLARKEFTYRGKNYQSHNRVLLSYEGATGGKTGFINASGFNLATSAKRKDRQLVAVVMGGRTQASRDSEMKSLLDKGFAWKPAKPKPAHYPEEHREKQVKDATAAAPQSALPPFEKDNVKLAHLAGV